MEIQGGEDLEVVGYFFVLRPDVDGGERVLQAQVLDVLRGAVLLARGEEKADVLRAEFGNPGRVLQLLAELLPGLEVDCEVGDPVEPGGVSEERGVDPDGDLRTSRELSEKRYEVLENAPPLRSQSLGLSQVDLVPLRRLVEHESLPQKQLDLLDGGKGFLHLAEDRTARGSLGVFLLRGRFENLVAEGAQPPVSG